MGQYNGLPNTIREQLSVGEQLIWWKEFVKLIQNDWAIERNPTCENAEVS